MATYKQIQAYVKQKYDFVPKTCWIAHVKEISGLHPKVAPNRYDPKVREVPCPEDKVKRIQEAFRHFRTIS